MVNSKERHFLERQQRRAAEIHGITQLDKVERRQKALREKKYGRKFRQSAKLKFVRRLR